MYSNEPRVQYRKNQLGAVQRLKMLLQDRPEVVYLYAGGVIDEGYQQQIQSFAEENFPILLWLKSKGN